MSQRGNIFIPLLIVVAVLVGILLYSLSKKSVTTQKQPSEKKETEIELKSEYENPFSKDAQYVNPFASYKNPFDTLRE